MWPSRGARDGMTKVTPPFRAEVAPLTPVAAEELPGAGGAAASVRGPSYLSGRTTPRISIEPAPASVTLRPGRGACTIAPSPMYIPTWLASPW